MLSLVVLAILFTGSYGSESRIVNGTDAKEGEFPFAVSLRKNASHICGATILNEKFILTAAHCVCKNNSPKDSKLYTIQYGLTKITKDPINTVQVSKITCNNFDSESLVYDSAVLELESPIPPSDSWKPVKICKKFDTHKEQVGTIIGWGRIGQDGPLSENLQKLDVDIYDDTVCGVTYNLEHHICFGAKNAGACNGDSGTALLVNGVQVGIASFISAECGIANKKHSNVYSKVPTYFKWIKSIAGHVET